jgi:hypothetical protein
MRTIIVGALVTSATALVAAPGQTVRPGQMTEARVWVQNRGSSEALPVDVREVNVDRPIRVQVVNGMPYEQMAPNPVNVRVAGADPVNVRVVRTVWEYKSIMVDSGADPVTALNGEGAAGWETTGIVATGQGKMTLLLKRVR